MKRATGITTKTTNGAAISIHALVKRATPCSANNYTPVYNFNPRPREEGDDKNITNSGENTQISIHALVKRATKKLVGDLDYKIISIHALVKRATHAVPAEAENLKISIHALVKRATEVGRLFKRNRTYFNPRPREEGDLNTFCSCKILLPFQSTPS